VDVWPDDVHTPWVPEGAYRREKRAGDDNAPNYESLANFKAVLREYDRQVGRLLDGLKDLGIGDNTILIFSSDNGPLPTFRGKRAGGLRGSKISLYEGGDREPLIVRWPGHVPAGRVDDQTVINGVDLFPIFCKLTGTAIPAEVKFDGEDLSESFFGKVTVRKNPMFWEYGRNNISFDYPRNPHDHSPNVAMREGKWKLLINADASGLELYDLEADRNETKNVAEANPEVAKRLSGEALQWRKSLP
jgi:arylsulfatase A-like enzyme